MVSYVAFVSPSVAGRLCFVIEALSKYLNLYILLACSVGVIRCLCSVVVILPRHLLYYISGQVHQTPPLLVELRRVQNI